MKSSPIYKWELWADGTYRLTTKLDLLHLMVWEDASGWHYEVIQSEGAPRRVKASRKAIPTLVEAQRLCTKAVAAFLRETLKSLEAVGLDVTKVKVYQP